ncbi:MAG: methyltransferase domain-containing protein [Candidatus Aenigmarchaeota archaeon]|nr:methyltransferase domain-containing protein [Candidatus Aenigmarchaeota archaeon]NIQ18050.1 methyltransferase domain-containing protein [Candidatus Aenigmarchaeota archaeon]
MKTIPIDILKKFHQAKSGTNVVRTYTDKNPLVRWLYWSRLRKMLHLGREVEGKKVLDLGCGEGVFLPALSEGFAQVYGLDIDTRAAKEVLDYYKLNNVKLFQNNFFDNSFDDNCFDIVFAASVLEHFAERDKLFKEIVRLIVPDGYLIFSSPTETWFYQLGRKIFGYKKPDDHYFSASEIANTGEKYLRLIDKKYTPFGRPSLFAAFCIYVFQKG